MTEKANIALPNSRPPLSTSERQGFHRRLGLFARKKPMLAVLIVAIFLASLYWCVLASDRYVSEARVVVNRTDLSNGQTLDFASLLGGGSGGRDQHLLRDHLLSVDMLNKLDAKLKLRDHFSDSSRDWFSRLRAPDIEQEWFHEHYLSRVHVIYDEVGGVLSIKAQAYTPEMAQAIATMLVDEGELYMNEMAHQLAREQVAFLEKEVAQMGERVLKARRTVVSFQNDKGLISPKGTAESLSAIVSRLEAELSELKTRRSAMLGYLSKSAPDIVQIDMQIAANEAQIKQEGERLTSPKGKALNRALEQFQRLEVEAEFAQDIYRTALVALEKGRVEATRTLKKLSVIQAPTLPQYPLEPRRAYNLAVFIMAALLLVGIAHLIVTIVREHKD